MIETSSTLELTPLHIDYISNFMHSYLVNNKAKGKLAEAEFCSYFKNQKSKYLELKNFEFVSGVWIFSPKTTDFYKHRTAFIRFFPSSSDQVFLENVVLQLSNSLETARIRSIIFKPEVDFNDKLKVKFNLLIPSGEELVSKEDSEILSGELWPRGRIKKVTSDNLNQWDADIDKRFFELAGSNPDEFLTMYLDEYFLSAYLRENLKINIVDPYDTDGFIVKISDKNNSKVWPIELKEKSAAYDFPFFPHDYKNPPDVTSRFLTEIADQETLERLNTIPNKDPNKIYFGLDGGRILMMLRICLPLNTDGIYVVRRMRNSSITLGNILGKSKAEKLEKIGVESLNDYNNKTDNEISNAFQTKTSENILNQIERLINENQRSRSLLEVKHIGQKKAKELAKAMLNKIGDLETVYDPRLLSVVHGVDFEEIKEQIRLLINYENLVKSNPSRNHFLEWRATSLSSVLLGSSWNPIGGGRGMTGTPTITFVLTLNEFMKLDKCFLDLLKRLDSLSLVDSVKSI